MASRTPPRIMHIEPFGVEIWMNEWETRCELNLAETCVQSLTIAELLDMTGRTADDLGELLSMKLTYGDIEGSPRLRAAVASLFERQGAANVVITHGTIGANMLVHRTVVEPDDRVVAIVPSYQQHYSIPASIGAEVQQLWLRPEHEWLPDLEQLRSMVAGGVKLVALTNPNNPTGALLDRSMLEEIVDIAASADAWLLCDEVYRGTDEAGTGMTTSIADLYDKGISTGSVSKAYSLAGLRLGWIVGPTEFLEDVAVHRDYDTISVGMIDDHFATLALEHRDAVLDRARALTATNRAVLDEWIDHEPSVSWIRPQSGTTALLDYDLDIGSHDLCVQLLQETGVMFTPGSALGIEGYVRIGYANSTEILRKGLDRFSEFLASRRQLTTS